MNRVALKLTLSTSVISQLAGQAATVDRQDRLADGQIVSAERQMLQGKGWAFSGWEPPHDPTSIPGLLPGL